MPALSISCAHDTITFSPTPWSRLRDFGTVPSQFGIERSCAVAVESHPAKGMRCRDRKSSRMAHPDKEHRDRYMRSSACLRFGGSRESEEGNSKFRIQNCR